MLLLEGLHLPLTTPFRPDGRLNLEKLEDNVRRYSKTPASGLVVFARNGQPTLVSDRETVSVLGAVAKGAKPEKVLIAGIARDSTTQTVELIAHAAELGYDAALIPLPSILCADKNEAELMSFFNTVGDQSPLPVVINSGSLDKGQISAGQMIQLARHPNVVGAIYAGSDCRRLGDVLQATASVRREATVTSVFAAVTRRMLLAHAQSDAAFLSVDGLSARGSGLTGALPTMSSKLKTRSRAVGFQMLWGRTDGMLDALQAGAVGAVPSLAAGAPQACYEVLAAWKDGDPALAAEKQERLRESAFLVEEMLGISGVKYACDLNGYFGGRPRLPDLPLTGAERAQLERCMAGIRS